MTHERKCAVVFKCFCFLFHGIHLNFAESCCGSTKCDDISLINGKFTSISSNGKTADVVCNSGFSLNHISTSSLCCCSTPFPSCVSDETTTDNDKKQSSTSYITISTSTSTLSTLSTTLTITETRSSSTISTHMPSVGNSNSSTILETSFLHTLYFDLPVSTVSTPPLKTSKSMVWTTISNFHSTKTETTQHSSKLHTAPSKRTEYSKQGSFPPSGSVGIAFGVLILLVVFIVGLIILRRKQRGCTLFGKKRCDYLGSNIHSNAAYDPNAPSVDNVSMTSKDSGFGKHDESGEEEQMDGEYNTIMLHYPDVNQQLENTYSHMDGSPTADSTYSHIPNSKDALFDNTYSHMANDKPLKVLEPSDTDTTYNHLGDSSCSKHKDTKEETYNDTYNHTQINPGCLKTDPDDQDDNYSHINQKESNAGKKEADVQRPTKATPVCDKMNEFTKIAAERMKQYDESVNSSMTNAEGVNNAESHTYFVLESNANQHPKQAPYDYAVVAMPGKDRTKFKVVDSPTDPPHEYFVIEPEFKVVDPPTDTPHEYFVTEPTTET